MGTSRVNPRGTGEVRRMPSLIAASRRASLSSAWTLIWLAAGNAPRTSLVTRSSTVGCWRRWKRMPVMAVCRVWLPATMRVAALTTISASEISCRDCGCTRRAKKSG
ncbi:hypothetical protein BDV37DRAFT_239374 [Aspergillus pseudonomiae]|uniref:Uncharacterized protein n=1 Tax=Aspergillus pseudonomiae TaxID=1506151 RepID=A0A5N7DPJ1_9EURO|nr:uncharacterized protein BDV37DRAFT_239374 [Aspergillus pseudonomiae]KAE8408336.1 hypothetical protein BDV37DRAFT_239374 [Aspergillus pseudonomiae]